MHIYNGGAAVVAVVCLACVVALLLEIKKRKVSPGPIKVFCYWQILFALSFGFNQLMRAFSPPKENSDIIFISTIVSLGCALKLGMSWMKMKKGKVV